MSDPLALFWELYIKGGNDISHILIGPLSIWVTFDKTLWEKIKFILNNNDLHIPIMTVALFWKVCCAISMASENIKGEFQTVKKSEEMFSACN